MFGCMVQRLMWVFYFSNGHWAFNILYRVVIGWDVSFSESMGLNVNRRVLCSHTSFYPPTPVPVASLTFRSHASLFRNRWAIAGTWWRRCSTVSINNICQLKDTIMPRVSWCWRVHREEVVLASLQTGHTHPTHIFWGWRRSCGAAAAGNVSQCTVCLATVRGTMN